MFGFFIPLVVWFLGGEEDGGDVGIFAEGVANLEILHQLEQFMLHVGVCSIAPNGFEICGGETTFVLDDCGSVGDFVDGVGSPGWFEDDAMFESAVFLEV